MLAQQKHCDNKTTVWYSIHLKPTSEITVELFWILCNYFFHKVWSIYFRELKNMKLEQLEAKLKGKLIKDLTMLAFKQRLLLLGISKDDRPSLLKVKGSDNQVKGFRARLGNCIDNEFKIIFGAVKVFSTDQLATIKNSVLNDINQKILNMPDEKVIAIMQEFNKTQIAADNVVELNKFYQVYQQKAGNHIKRIKNERALLEASHVAWLNFSADIKKQATFVAELKANFLAIIAQIAGLVLVLYFLTSNNPYDIWQFANTLLSLAMLTKLQGALLFAPDLQAITDKIECNLSKTIRNQKELSLCAEKREAITLANTSQLAPVTVPALEAANTTLVTAFTEEQSERKLPKVKTRGEARKTAEIALEEEESDADLYAMPGKNAYVHFNKEQVKQLIAAKNNDVRYLGLVDKFANAATRFAGKDKSGLKKLCFMSCIEKVGEDVVVATHELRLPKQDPRLFFGRRKEVRDGKTVSIYEPVGFSPNAHQRKSLQC